MVDTNRRSVASFALVCVYVALQRSAKAQLKQEWHCASVGAKDGQQGKVLSDDFCFQYYTNVSTGAPNYCCDKSGYYCQVKQIDVFTSNHVIKGNFRAGEFTFSTDGSGCDRPTTTTGGVCSVDRTRLYSGPTPNGIPDCGVGSNDPTMPTYCVVIENTVCLDNGQCGSPCPIGYYGGTPDTNGQCVPCPKGTWSDKPRAGSADACSKCPEGTYGSRPQGCCTWSPLEENAVYPAAYCLPCNHGEYGTDAGVPTCKVCPTVCTNGRDEGKYCTTELDMVFDEFGEYIGTHPHPDGNGILGAADIQRLGGTKFVTTAADCIRYGGSCNRTVTALNGVTNPLECERDWGPQPSTPPATRALPCGPEGCGPAFMQFDNHVYFPQHPDAPKDFYV